MKVKGGISKKSCMHTQKKEMSKKGTNRKK